MAISEAALDGMKANGRGWRAARMGIVDHAKLLGRINDGDLPPCEAEAAVMAIAAKFKAYRTSDANMKRDLEGVAEELEMIADCDVEEINAAMNRAYDALDYWRILA